MTQWSACHARMDFPYFCIFLRPVSGQFCLGLDLSYSAWHSVGLGAGGAASPAVDVPALWPTINRRRVNPGFILDISTRSLQMRKNAGVLDLPGVRGGVRGGCGGCVFILGLFAVVIFQLLH